MRIDILTLFPASVDAMMNVSILGRAQERGYITIKTHQIRDYTTNKQMQVDDYPYGGGRGAVMQADPLYRCWAHVCEEAGSRGHTIYLSPCGRTFTQSVARELKDKYDHLILVCGHYEGIDQRFIDECVDEELSMGDFVVTGGEIPAMAVTDAICRMVPGVLPEEECFTEESHWAGLLEYPQYSRPDEWHGRRVPDVLLFVELCPHVSAAEHCALVALFFAPFVNAFVLAAEQHVRLAPAVPLLGAGSPLTHP